MSKPIDKKQLELTIVFWQGMLRSSGFLMDVSTQYLVGFTIKCLEELQKTMFKTEEMVV